MIEDMKNVQLNLIQKFFQKVTHPSIRMPGKLVVKINLTVSGAVPTKVVIPM